LAAPVFISAIERGPEMVRGTYVLALGTLDVKAATAASPAVADYTLRTEP
jgi:hypothetical protein